MFWLAFDIWTTAKLKYNFLFKYALNSVTYPTLIRNSWNMQVPVGWFGRWNVHNNTFIKLLQYSIVITISILYVYRNLWYFVTEKKNWKATNTHRYYFYCSMYDIIVGFCSIFAKRFCIRFDGLGVRCCELCELP